MEVTGIPAVTIPAATTATPTSAMAPGIRSINYHTVPMSSVLTVRDRERYLGRGQYGLDEASVFLVKMARFIRLCESYSILVPQAYYVHQKEDVYVDLKS